MEKSVLNRVFCFLRQQGLVESESEFSRDWLARSDCYLRSVRFKRVQPSVSTVAVCASKLHYLCGEDEGAWHTLRVGSTVLRTK